MAQSPGSQQLLAIKEMLLEPEPGLSDEEQIARFKREADIHLQLSHANIVKAVEAGTDGDRHYLVMEYQPGHTWRDLMERERPPLPESSNGAFNSVTPSRPSTTSEWSTATSNPPTA